MSQVDGDTMLDELSELEVEKGENRPKADKYDGLSMSSAVERLVPVNTQEYERYKRAFCYQFSPHREEKHVIEPGPVATSLTVSLEHNGWKTYVHPEGLRYFFRDDPGMPVPVLTEAWMYDESEGNVIQACMDQIFRYMTDKGICFRATGSTPSTGRDTPGERTKEAVVDQGFDYFQNRFPVILVLEIRLSKKVGYYFVHHPMRRLFWLDKFDFSHDVKEVNIEHMPSHVGLEMTSQYWTHNEFFPHFYELTEDDLVEVDNVLSFALGDMMSSNSSCISAYTADQLKYIQKALCRYERREPAKRSQSTSDGRTLFRALNLLYHERFLNLYGERGARLDSQQSIHYSPHAATGHPSWYRHVLSALFSRMRDEDPDPEEGLVESELDFPTDKMRSSSLWMKFMALLMLGGPAIHAERLREVTRDGNINNPELAKYSKSMVEEWRDVALYGTVLLGANISFLAIQSIDEVGSRGPSRTPSQRASYFSVLASIGSIASSLALLTTVRHREIKESFIFAHQVHTSRWVLESHALTYSMPLSLAIWSLLSFFLSFAILWFESTDHVVMWLTGSACSMYVIFLLSTLLTFYLKKNPLRVVGGWIRRGSVPQA